MKNFIIFFFIVFVSSALYGQFEWVGDYGFSSSAAGFYKTSKDELIVVRESEDDAGFSVFDFDGDLVFGYSDPYSLNLGSNNQQGQQRVSDFIELRDTSFMIIMRDYTCTLPTNLDGKYLFSVLKFDKDWNPIFFEAPSVFTYTNNIFAAPLSGGSFVWTDGGGACINKVDANGNNVWTECPGFYSAQDMITTLGDTIIVATDIGVMVFDEDGNMDTLYQNVILDQIKILPSGNIIGQRSDSLILFTPTFGFIKSIGFSGSPIQYFSTSDDKVCVLAGLDSVLVFDHEFELLYEFQTTLPVLNSFIETAQDSIVILGTTCYGDMSINGSTCAPFIKKYSLDGVTTEDYPDIGVNSVEQQSIVEESNPPVGSYQLVYDPLKITVHNFGDQMVHDLKLNARFPTLSIGFTCLRTYQYLHKNFTGLSLKPNESIDLYWEDFTILFALKPNYPFDICIWASLPDQKLDRNNENDRFCSSFLVSDKEPAIEFGFSIYPNPSSSGSTIAYDLPTGSNGHIRVFNNMGLLMETRQISSGNGTTGLAKYPAGLYCVALEMDGLPVKVLKFVQM